MTSLNPEQLRAVLAPESKVLVVAGPGSGKTRVICERVARSASHSVAVVTLTNSAADEIKARLGPEVTARCWHIGTIHSLALKIVQDIEDIAILPEAEALELEAEAKARVGYRGTQAAFDATRATLLASGNLVGARDVTVAVASWITMQRTLGAYSFDGLIHRAQEWLRMHPLPDLDLVVDEAQDCAASDYRLFAMLQPRTQFMVGDGDQAIFGFRGGSMESFLALPTRGFTIYRLEHNYRCGDEICEVANALIEQNKQRIEKETFGNGAYGVVSVVAHVTEAQECAAISTEIAALPAGETFAVLCRTNLQVDRCRELLGLRVTGQALPTDWGRAKTLLAYLSRPANDWIAGAAAEVCGYGSAKEVRLSAATAGLSVEYFYFRPRLQSWSESLNWMAEHGISDESIHKIRGYGTMPPAEIIIAAGAEKENQISDVLTIHRAKGREWDHVFLPGFDALTFPSTGDVEEARRLAFVAITRARKRVAVSWAKRRTGYAGSVTTAASPFIGEMDIRNRPVNGVDPTRERRSPLQ